MAKVLITSIGVGHNQGKDYSSASYEIDNKIYENEKFIATALHKHIKFDKIFMVGTNNSIWEVVYGDLAKGDEGFSIEILGARENGTLKYFIPFIEKQLDETLGTKGSKCYIIKYGVNENELLENFNYFLDIARNLNNDDEVYIDITHSFRSLSLMSFVMSETISNSIKIPMNIKGVFYGMFEYNRENNKITPIVDLKLFFEFLEWSKAIRDFKQYGNSKDLLRLINLDKNDEFSKTFASFSDSLSMSNMKSIKNSVNQLKAKIPELRDTKNQIYKPIFDELNEFVKRLDVESFSLFQYNLAKWYQENHNYTLSYIVLIEAVITAIYENLNEPNIDNGQKAKQTILEWTNKNGYSPEKTKIRRSFINANKIRINIAHATDKSEQSPNQAIENLSLYIKNFAPLFKGKR